MLRFSDISSITLISGTMSDGCANVTLTSGETATLFLYECICTGMQYISRCAEGDTWLNDETNGIYEVHNGSWRHLNCDATYLSEVAKATALRADSIDAWEAKCNELREAYRVHIEQDGGEVGDTRERVLGWYISAWDTAVRMESVN